jgi:hypothetical protein
MIWETNNVLKMYFEMNCDEQSRGFESHSLRYYIKIKGFRGLMRKPLYYFRLFIIYSLSY